MRLGVILILANLSFSAKAQQLLFENFTSYQGLSQNSCYTIEQDGEGFMWFGTQDGLNRYDGKEFKTILPQMASGKKLPSNYISSLSFDSHRQLLWVGTIGGACMYDTRGDSLLKISERFPFASPLETIPINKIVSFTENEYWFVTFNRGLVLLNTQNKSIRYYFSDSANQGKVSSIVLHEGGLIVATLQRLYHLVPQANATGYDVQPLLASYPFPEIRELYSYHDHLWVGTISEGCYLVNSPVTDNSLVKHFEKTRGGIGSFVTDANDNLWIGTRGTGLMIYNPFTQKIQTASNDQYDERTLGKNFVLSLFRDRQGLIWCGLSGGGVAKYDPLKYQFTVIDNDPVKENSLPDNMVFDIYKSKNGIYYAGTQNKGIAEWNPNSNQFISYRESSMFGAVNNTIYDMTEDMDGNLWIASWGGLMQLDWKTRKFSFDKENNLLVARKLYAIHKLSNADSLFVTGQSGPAFYSLKEKKWKPIGSNIMHANAYIGRYIYEDSSHNLWICSVGAGLIRYDYRSGEFRVIEPVKNYSIYTRHLLHRDSVFWLATDNGIVLYDYKKDKVIRHITLNAPNASNVCYGIQQDKNGYFWTSTNTGLYRIHPLTYTVHNYDMVNGLSFLEFNTACTLKEEDGSLLFGGVGGITQFNPAQLKEDTFSPLPLITSINVNDKPFNGGRALAGLHNIRLNHLQNFLTISFAVTNFSRQTKNQFSYRLKGLSDNWTNSGNNNFANYTSLPPGDYTFQLRSANSDGKWCEGMTELVIYIAPPWWQTWWFRLGVLLAIATIITLLVRRRIKTIRHEADMKHRIAETEMMALRAQMNPHFIFNCINSIDSLIQENDKYRATIYLNKFAKLIRNILDSSKQNAVPLAKDVETLKLYIELEQLRNENKFTAEIKADEELLQYDYKVPPLIIQPFVENAILHGLCKRPDNNGVLTISISRQNGHLEYIVEDNGVGRGAEGNSLRKEKQSYGLQITNDRIKLFNEEENASVQFTDLFSNDQPSGTHVKVLLKIK